DSFRCEPLMSSTRNLPPPSTVSLPDPRPSIVRLWSSVNSPLVSLIVWPESLLSNWTVSPFFEVVRASRSEPAPLALVFVTVKLLGTVRSSRASSEGRHGAGRKTLLRPRPGRDVWRAAFERENQAMRLLLWGET